MYQALAHGFVLFMAGNLRTEGEVFGMGSKSIMEWLVLFAILITIPVFFTAWGIVALSLFIRDCLEDWNDRPLVGI